MLLLLEKVGRGKAVQTRSVSFVAAVGLHIALILFLILSFEKTLSPLLPVNTSEPKPIIDAVMVSHSNLQQEVERLEAIEAKKRAHEQARERELARKEKEATENRLKEEKLAQELKKQNEALKLQALEQKKAELEQEKTRQLKLKAQQEELKKLAKEKENLLAAKQKAEQERKAAELAKQKAMQAQQQKEQAEKIARQAANQQMIQERLMQHASLIKAKLHQNWRQPLGLDFAGLNTVVEVRLLLTGDVIDVRVLQSSGNLEFDRSTELAVRKASPLPMPAEAELAEKFRQFTFEFDPRGV